MHIQTIQISGLNKTVALVFLTHMKFGCNHSAVSKDPDFFTYHYTMLVLPSILKIAS